MKKYKLAVVGATGVVGRTALKILEEKNLPIFEYGFFCSKTAAGSKIHFKGMDYIAEELKNNSFDKGYDFAIFCAGGAVSKKFAPIAVSKNCIVIDNSSFYRMDPSVPLVIPEVNPEDILHHKGIIANPNCSTIQAVACIAPLHKKYITKRIVYSTYQAVSGAGMNGIEDLKNGINKIDFLSKFPYPIFNNCIPHIDDFTDSLYTKEEEKMINETRKILKTPDLAVTATAVRVPVFNSHSESINIEFENNFKLYDVIDTLRNSPGIVVHDNIEKNIYPMAINATGNDEVLVGRIRRDFSLPNGLNLWVVADNIRKGAATNAIQILEKLCE